MIYNRRKHRLVSNIFSHPLTFQFAPRYEGTHLHFSEGGLVQHLEDQYGVGSGYKKKFIR